MKIKRSSKYCLICRNLVFSMAQDIGPKTHGLVRKLYYSGISVYDSYKMDFLISSDIFKYSEIERAAALTLNLTNFSFSIFEFILANL
jgi:hypothetical protein